MQRAIWVLWGIAACVPQEGGARRAGDARSEPVVIPGERMVAAVAAEGARCEAAACDRACEAGNAQACALAAERSWNGQYGHAFDPAAALRYARRGCDDNDGLACTLLGLHHANGVATAWAPAEAVAAFEKACQTGVGLGCLELGTMYSRGHGVDVDPGKAAAAFVRAKRHFRAACEGSDPRACAYVERTKDGDIPDDLARRACAGGFATSCVDVLVHRISSGNGVIAEEIDTLDRMCTAGEGFACTVLAHEVSRARRPGARARVVALTIRACELGDPESCLVLGRLNEATDARARGNDVKHSYFDRACDRASGRACLYLAQDTYVTGPAARVAAYAQRACELGEAAGCTMMVRNQLEQNDVAGADRWAREGCRRGARYDCEHLVDRNLELPWTTGGDRKRLYRRGCGRGEAPACQRLAAIEHAEEPVLAALRDAVTRRDAAAFARLADGEVKLHGLWFESAGCAAQFARKDALPASAGPAFLACLAGHGLRLEPHASVGGTPALVYDPGVVLELDITSGQVQQITALQPGSLQRDAAPIASEVLASHLVAGTHTVEPDPGLRAAIIAAPDMVAGVELTVCIDTTGKVKEARARPVTPDRDRYASYVHAVEAAAAQWRFRPFEVHGKTVPVCALDVFAYPPDRRREVALATAAGGAPFDRDGPRTVAPTELDSQRIAGNKLIVPDDATKTEIAVSGQSRLVGTFKLCLDEAGQITSVGQLKSTGFPAYDRTIDRELHNWRYRPFWIDGRPQPVCTAVTFIYSQR